MSSSSQFPAKVTDLLSALRDRPSFSLEFFPPKTDRATDALLLMIRKMTQAHRPLWVSVTMGAGGCVSDCDSTIDLSTRLLQDEGLEVVVHVTGLGKSKRRMREILNRLVRVGARNILALRGDVSDAFASGDFPHAIDVVRFLRAEFGDQFCIGVAGYPEGHIESESLESDIKYLAEKVNAGADFVVSQLFYDFRVFAMFLDLCKLAGITVPVIPGVMPITSIQQAFNMAHFCGFRLPQELRVTLNRLRDDDIAVREYGVLHGVEICKEVFRSERMRCRSVSRSVSNGGSSGRLEIGNERRRRASSEVAQRVRAAPPTTASHSQHAGVSLHCRPSTFLHLHFYTLNQERPITEILDKLEMPDAPEHPEFQSKGREDEQPVFFPTASRGG